MLDINKIAQDKITAMHESGETQKYLEEKVEKLVLDGISSALSGWRIQCEIADKVSKDVSRVVTELDFTAYNSFIAEKVKQITTGALREDISQKIQSFFDGIFIKKRESIKLSEIFDAYREWLIEDLDESEQYELGNRFCADIEENERYGWLTCIISKEELEKGYLSSSKNDFSFTVHRSYEDKTKGSIGQVYFSGTNIKDNFVYKHYNNFETLILNLMYNDTPIEIDVESENYIDTSLGLDM